MAAALVFAMGGCATTTRVVQSVGPQHVQHLSARIDGPYVPEGTVFTVRLDQSIDTESRDAPLGFTARVERPLATQDGRVAVPAGAVIRGRIAELHGGRAPLILLDFQTIGTVHGDAPVHVQVRHAERLVYRGGEEMPLAPAGPHMQTAIYGGYTENSQNWYFSNTAGPIGGGPRGSIYVRPREVHLSAGARLELMLVQPIPLAIAE
jgi:hypothetical protein